MYSRQCLFSVFWLVAVLVGCGGDGALDAQSVSLGLIVVGYDVDRVDFEITGSAIATPVSGQFNVNDEEDPPIWAAVMNLPVGTGYMIALNATGPDGSAVCSGSADFEVTADETNKVDIVLTCEIEGTDVVGHVDIDVTFEINEGNACPRIHFATAMPLCIPYGESAIVETLISDKNDDPLNVQWSATSGSFSDPNAESTEYVCDYAKGVQTLTVTVDDGDPDCEKSKEVEVECRCGSKPHVHPRPHWYWSKWNRCTHGNHAHLADKYGGAANGYHLIEDVIPQTVGVLIVDNCKDAVNILRTRDIETRRRRYYDGAYRLARSLLTTLFNFAAGAPTCAKADEAVAEASALLESIGFDGTGSYLPPVRGGANDRAKAIALSRTLNKYNYGLLCRY